MRHWVCVFALIVAGCAGGTPQAAPNALGADPASVRSPRTDYTLTLVSHLLHNVHLEGNATFSCVRLDRYSHELKSGQTLKFTFGADPDCTKEASFHIRFYNGATCIGEWTKKPGADWHLRAENRSCTLKALDGNALDVRVDS